jgi:hypothetical protein
VRAWHRRVAGGDKIRGERSVGGGGRGRSRRRSGRKLSSRSPQQAGSTNAPDGECSPTAYRLMSIVCQRHVTAQLTRSARCGSGLAGPQGTTRPWCSRRCSVSSRSSSDSSLGRHRVGDCSWVCVGRAYRLQPGKGGKERGIWGRRQPAPPYCGPKFWQDRAFNASGVARPGARALSSRG